MPREELPTITADKERIKAALFNVVDNAVKYVKKEEGVVTVTVTTNSKSETLNSKSPLSAGSRQNAGQIQNPKFQILL